MNVYSHHSGRLHTLSTLCSNLKSLCIISVLFVEVKHSSDLLALIWGERRRQRCAGSHHGKDWTCFCVFEVWQLLFHDFISSIQTSLRLNEKSKLEEEQQTKKDGNLLCRNHVKNMLKVCFTQNQNFLLADRPVKKHRSVWMFHITTWKVCFNKMFFTL